MIGKRFSAWIAGLIVVFIWSTSFSFARAAVIDIGIWPFRLYSAICALMPLAVFVPSSYRAVNKVSLKEKWTLFLVIFINGSLVATVNIISLSYLTASTVLALIYTMPAFAGIIEAGYLKSFRPATFVAAALAVGGVMVYTGTGEFTVGLLVVLVNAAIWGFATFLTSRITPAITARDRVTSQCVVSLVFSLITFGIWLLASRDPLVFPSTLAIIGILYSGLLNGAVVFWLWYVAISGLGSSRASYLTLLVPICGAGFAWGFFHEKQDIGNIIGIALICGSMLVKFTSRDERPINSSRD